MRQAPQTDPRDDSGSQVIEGLLSSLANTPAKPRQEELTLTQQIAQLAQRMLGNRAIGAKWQNPAKKEVRVRTAGIFNRPNPIDQSRAEAVKAIEDLIIMNTKLVAGQIQYSVSGQMALLEAFTALLTMVDAYPEDLRPIAQALALRIIDQVQANFDEGLTMIGEYGRVEIIQAMLREQNRS